MSTILLVEDSPTQAMEIRLMLEERGHQVSLVTDGTAAMEALQKSLPEVVVTDLEMPGMSGLELVEAMQAQFPQIPAILITAQGSEALAVQALRRGAAAYVPKNMLGMLLNTTIRDVLGVLRADQSYAQLVDSLTFNRFVFRLPSEPFLIAPLVDLVVQMVSGMSLLNSNELIRFSNALDHAIQNGMLYGNLELNAEQVATFRDAFGDGIEPEFIVERRSDSAYCDRRLEIDIQVSETEIRCTLRDEGIGFNAKLINADVESAIQNEDGHGIGLITSFMDQVSVDESQHQLLMVKHCTRQVLV
ncbi:ATP-binding response regulator [Roseimaritima ulvae]|uniref:Sensory transduction protein regX3 n=1 Tax=Roseimaritima ulvae TaxID=980254 RepID=A0A5B9QP08_9BACT|nr:response regulator [Roseimaritima ulvae]QEG38746.1 Sensory transduction protein regX3 [Roseimaritima ulvae]